MTDHMEKAVLEVAEMIEFHHDLGYPPSKNKGNYDALVMAAAGLAVKRAIPHIRAMIAEEV